MNLRSESNRYLSGGIKTGSLATETPEFSECDLARALAQHRRQRQALLTGRRSAPEAVPLDAQRPPASPARSLTLASG